jgi:hypothetical protein
MLIIQSMGPIPESATLPYYVWEIPEKISVRLHFDVIDRMSPEILRGLGALKRRGAEVGGLLLGRQEPGVPQRVTVEDFEPIPSEYRTGPSYNLSQKDLVAFEAAIARRRDDLSSLTVVGFYRSHTRDELFMDEADLGIATRYFPGIGSVFLLVKPFATKPSVGGFFFWEDGAINREASHLLFPFHRTELGGGEVRVPEPAARRTQERPSLPPYSPALEPAASPDIEDDPWPAIRQANLSILNSPPEPKSRIQWRWVIVPAFFVLALAAGYFGFQNMAGARVSVTPPPPPMPAADAPLPLKLSVAEKGEQLDVTWDRNAPAIALAQRGVLSILDGVNRRDLELSGAQLRNGRVLYSRLSQDVGLHLVVFPEGREPVSESIRIVSADPVPLPVSKPGINPGAMTESVEKSEIEPPARKPPAAAPRPAPKAPVEAAPPPPAPAAASETAPPEVELQRPARRR